LTSFDSRIFLGLMRRRLFFLKFLKLIAFLGFGSSFFLKRTVSGENELTRSFIRYRDNPNDDTAYHLYKTLPLYNSNVKQSRQEIDNLYYQSFIVLKNHLATGLKGAIDLAFRLFSITYGAERSALIWAIAPCIHINPTYLLVSLKTHSHLVSKEMLLGNLGLEFVDNIALQDLEIERRILSLENVNDPSLLRIRNECIGILANKHHDACDYMMEVGKYNISKSL